MKKIKAAAGIAMALGSISVAQAGFVPLSTVGSGLNTIDIVGNNQFLTRLAGLGVTEYTLGGSLRTDAAGTVTYYYYGKEAAYQNIFTAWDSDTLLTYDSGFSPTQQDRFKSPTLIGTVDVLGGLFDFRFCSNSAVNVSVGCLTNSLNDWTNLGSKQSMAFSVSGNDAWIFWDDSGAGPDDNHDDMLIRAKFTPHKVPEPGTLGLLGAGLLGVWLAARRNRKFRATN